VTLSIDFPRYAAPGLLCACLPAAVFISALFRWSNENLLAWRSRPIQLTKRTRTYAAIALAAWGVANVTLVARSVVARPSYNQDLQATARFLNETVGPAEVIDTYDTALFYLLDRPFVYPPDDYHLQTRAERAAAHSMPLDPSAKYLVIGDWSDMFEIASPIPPEFRKLRAFGQFTIYVRDGVAKTG
jgi:hypothetical protein